MNDPEFDNYFEELIELGAVIDTGALDLQGNPIYKFDLKVLQEVRPDMYEVMIDELDKDLIELYRKGLIDIDYDDNLQATFQINEAGKHYMKTGELPENIDR
jgi:hypothetical protein